MLVLATTLFDQKGGLRWLCDLHLSDLIELFDEITVVATLDTDKDLIKQFGRAGIQVLQPKKQGIFNGYYLSLKAAHQAGADTVFYADFDRILHWIHTYPDELKKVIRKSSKYDYLILGRTPRAHASHHEPLYLTEPTANRMISLAMEEREERDYLGGAFTMSRGAVAKILQKGTCKFFELYSIWPLLLKRSGYAPQYLRCEGLEWETPDRFQVEVKKAGGVAAWRETQSNPIEWKRRADIAQQIMHPAYRELQKRSRKQRRNQP